MRWKLGVRSEELGAVALPQIIGGSGYRGGIIPMRLQPQGIYSAFTIVRRLKEIYLPVVQPKVRIVQLPSMKQPVKNRYSFPAIRGAA